MRKGLLEDRLRESPGDGRRSAVDKVSEQDYDQQKPSEFITGSRETGETGTNRGGLIVALPGIDGSASMLLPLFRNPAICCDNTQSNTGGRTAAGDVWLVTRK